MREDGAVVKWRNEEGSGGGGGGGGDGGGDGCSISGLTKSLRLIERFTTATGGGKRKREKSSTAKKKTTTTTKLSWMKYDCDAATVSFLGELAAND